MRRREAHEDQESQEPQEYQEYQEAREYQRQSERGGVIAPNHHPILDLSTKTVPADISVHTTEDESEFSRATVDNSHQYSQNFAATSSYSIYSPINPSTA